MGSQSMSGASLSGFHAQAVRLATIANNVANSGTEDFQSVGTQFNALEGGGVEAVLSQNGSGVDLGSEMTQLSEAEVAYNANAAAFEAGADLWQMLSVVQRD
jgi:flagellar basal-body rod protein FlgC